MLSVVMLNVIYAVSQYALYAQCHYANCCYAECHYAECCGAEEEGLSYTSMSISFFLYFLVVWHTSAVKFPPGDVILGSAILSPWVAQFFVYVRSK